MEKELWWSQKCPKDYRLWQEDDTSQPFSEWHRIKYPEPKPAKERDPLSEAATEAGVIVAGTGISFLLLLVWVAAIVLPAGIVPLYLITIPIAAGLTYWITGGGGHGGSSGGDAGFHGSSDW